MNRSALQIATAIVGLLLAVLAVLMLALGTGSPLYIQDDLAHQSIALDNQLRFAGGLVLTIALVLFWHVIPRIERELTLYRVFWGMGFLGGVGRLISMVIVGPPPPSLFALMVFELVGAPLFIYWQWRVALQHGVVRRGAEG